MPLRNDKSSFVSYLSYHYFRLIIDFASPKTEEELSFVQNATIFCVEPGT